MKAFTRHQYGGPEILKLEETDMPALGNDDVLIRTIANSINPADWHILRGKPFFARFTYGLFTPKYKTVGTDFSGVIEKVGKNVGRFRIGDRVFGSTLGGGVFAEYISVPAAACTLMPADTSFLEMACTSIAGLTALQALTTHGQLKHGQSVLINGATGGVGHFAVQIARSIGANVTAVCSGRNAGFVKSLGAGTVIAYDKESIHSHQGKYDLVVDVQGNLDFNDLKRMGRRAVAGGFTTMRHMIGVLIKAGMSKFRFKQFTVDINTRDLDAIAILAGSGKIKPFIEKTYSYEQIPEAICYSESGHMRGKIGITWPT